MGAVDGGEEGEGERRGERARNVQRPLRPPAPPLGAPRVSRADRTFLRKPEKVGLGNVGLTSPIVARHKNVREARLARQNLKSSTATATFTFLPARPLPFAMPLNNNKKDTFGGLSSPSGVPGGRDLPALRQGADRAARFADEYDSKNGRGEYGRYAAEEEDDFRRGGRRGDDGRGGSRSRRGGGDRGGEGGGRGSRGGSTATRHAKRFLMPDEPFTGTLRIFEARGLVKADVFGKADPYVKIKDNLNKQKTRVQQRTLDPIFNEEFQVDLTSGVIELEVFDKDVGKKDDFLGYKKLTKAKWMAGYLNGGLYSETLPLEKRPGSKDKVTGSLSIELMLPPRQRGSGGRRRGGKGSDSSSSDAAGASSGSSDGSSDASTGSSDGSSDDSDDSDDSDGSESES